LTISNKIIKIIYLEGGSDDESSRDNGSLDMGHKSPRSPSAHPRRERDEACHGENQGWRFCLWNDFPSRTGQERGCCGSSERNLSRRWILRFIQRNRKRPTHRHRLFKIVGYVGYVGYGRLRPTRNRDRAHTVFSVSTLYKIQNVITLKL